MACNQKFLKEIVEIFFFSLSYFCLDTKVPKNQGKKNAARSANQLSGSIKFWEQGGRLMSDFII